MCQTSDNQFRPLNSDGRCPRTSNRVCPLDACDPEESLDWWDKVDKRWVPLYKLQSGGEGNRFEKRCNPMNHEEKEAWIARFQESYETKISSSTWEKIAAKLGTGYKTYPVAILGDDLLNKYRVAGFSDDMIRNDLPITCQFIEGNDGKPHISCLIQVKFVDGKDVAYDEAVKQLQLNPIVPDDYQGRFWEFATKSCTVEDGWATKLLKDVWNRIASMGGTYLFGMLQSPYTDVVCTTVKVPIL